MNTLRASLSETIDQQRDSIGALAEDLFAHAELGFRETRTSGVVSAALSDVGLVPEENLGITGIKVVLDSGRPGPTVGVLAELDGIRVPGHPLADPETHAAHACGHHAQLAALIAAATAVVQTDAVNQLHGRIAFLAVPAEEYGDMAYRLELVKRGHIRFLGGKSELIRIGAFDDVDMALMIHLAAGRSAGTRGSMNGFVAKRGRFLGRAAHAGCAPHEGVNALNAATLALQAIHMQRETLRDDDHVRIHPVLHHGGSAVNVVPPEVTMEMQVRAAAMDAVFDASVKVDRALRAGASAIGCDLEIETLPGYLPLASCEALNAVFRQEIADLAPDLPLEHMPHRCSSTDMGDVSQIMPAAHPHIGGAGGTLHGPDFRIDDPTLAYLLPAKALCACLCELLGNEARRARGIIENHTPAMTKAQYLEVMEACWETVRAYA